MSKKARRLATDMTPRALKTADEVRRLEELYRRIAREPGRAENRTQETAPAGPNSPDKHGAERPQVER